MQGLTAVGGRKAEFHPSLMRRLGLPLLAMSSALSVPAAHAGSWVSTATLAMPPQNISQPSALPAGTPLRITVALKVQNKPQLDQLALAVNTPGNAQYGHFLTPAQFEQSYSPSAAQAQAVVEYLQQSGFSNIQVSPNRLAISAQGPASAAEAAFNTPLVQFLNSGKLQYANTSVAQVPASLNGIVASVIGLQSTGRMQTQIVHQGSSSARVPASGAVHTASTGLPQIIPEFTASMTRVAYDADAAPTGLGTSVAVLTWGNVSQVPADLLAYEKLNSLPQVPFKNIVVGSPSTSTSGLDEWDLDSQASSGIATNLRQILMYSVYDGDDADLAMGVHQIVSDDLVKAVNMSFGGCEEINFLDGSLVSMDQGFEQGAVEGITFFAASGDGGASCQLIANAGEPGVLGAVEYPGSSNWVVTSGGTSLFINSDGSYDTEISWISGGGGVSLFEYAQSWQQPVLPPLSTALGLADPDLGLGFPSRGVPDVAMNADDLLSPTVIVVKGATEAVGGTSVASPLSMGSFARFQAAHGECYGFAAPLYYAYVPLTGAVPGVLEEIDAAIGSIEALALGAAPLVPLEPGLGQPATGFHDITVGFNFLYPATPGWDYTTGLGSFDVAAVNAELPAISCAPEVPFNLTAGAVNGQVQLAWGTSPGASSYAVYAGTAPGAESPSPVASGSTTSNVVSGLAGTYYFTVEAANAKGSSTSSNEVEVSIPVAIPSALKVTGSTASSVSLSWGASGNASDYYVFEGSASGAESGKGIYSAGTSATISGLKSGTQYYFTVKGYNHASGLSSAASNEVSATTAP
jgi:subtilase family serine protease